MIKNDKNLIVNSHKVKYSCGCKKQMISNTCKCETVYSTSTGKCSDCS